MSNKNECVACQIHKLALFQKEVLLRSALAENERLRRALAGLRQSVDSHVLDMSINATTSTHH